MQQLLSSQEESREHFHHTLFVQTDRKECQPFICGGVHETVSQENLQPSMLTGGDQNQQLQPSPPHAVWTCNTLVSPQGYVTKAEKSNMQDLWQVSSHSSIYSKLRSFGIRCLRSRECGLYEASDLPLGDHLCEKSTTIKWIDVSPSQNRKRRLRNHSKLVEIREMNPYSRDIFKENLVDNFYPKRPDDIDEICLYDFVAEYEKWGVDRDGNPVYPERTKPILPNHRIYDPGQGNERENYYYSLLLLFVPFRNEADVIEEGETAESAFERHLEENDALNTHSEKLQRMLMARERVQKINEARRAQQEDIGTDPGPVEDNDGLQVAGEATSAMNDVLDLQNNESNGPSLEELVLSLNTDHASLCTDT